MNTLSVMILALSALFILFGFLFGLKRGLSRSLLRLILVAGSAAGAFVLRATVGNTVLNTPLIGGKTIFEYVHSQLPEDFASVASLLDPVIRILVLIVCFLLSFAVFSLATWVLMAILNLFFRKKARLLGAIVGLVQGVAVALVVAVVLNGLFLSAGKVASIEQDGKPVLDLSALPVKVDFEDYKNSALSQKIGKIGAPLWNELSTCKDGEGKEESLDTTLDALCAAAAMADQLKGVDEINFDGGLTAENVGEVKSIFASLDEIEMTPEVREKINETVAEIADSLGLPIDVSAIDFTTVENFAAEGEVLETVMNFQNGEDVDTGKLMEDLADSALILTMADSLDISISDNLSAERKAEAKTAIENLPAETDPQTIERLEKLFGVSGD